MFPLLSLGLFVQRFLIILVCFPAFANFTTLMDFHEIVFLFFIALKNLGFLNHLTETEDEVPHNVSYQPLH